MFESFPNKRREWRGKKLPQQVKGRGKSNLRVELDPQKSRCGDIHLHGISMLLWHGTQTHRHRRVIQEAQKQLTWGKAAETRELLLQWGGTWEPTPEGCSLFHTCATECAQTHGVVQHLHAHMHADTQPFPRGATFYGKCIVSLFNYCRFIYLIILWV